MNPTNDPGAEPEDHTPQMNIDHDLKASSKHSMTKLHTNDWVRQGSLDEF